MRLAYIEDLERHSRRRYRHTGGILVGHLARALREFSIQMRVIEDIKNVGHAVTKGEQAWLTVYEKDIFGYWKEPIVRLRYPLSSTQRLRSFRK